MARSLRSQRVRRMKVVRRNVYYRAKEMERLKTMVANTKKRELEEIANVMTLETLRSNMKSQETTDGDVETTMDVDAKKAKMYDKKTMKDQNGQYPIWLHPRKIRKVEAKKREKMSSSKVKRGFKSRRRTKTN